MAFAFFVLAAAAVTASPQATAAPTTPAASVATTSLTVPAATKITVHLTKTISSHDAQSGEKFAFVVDNDVTISGNTAIGRCASGSGTIVFSGKHGINGHEGNLHLRFDSVNALDGTTIALNPTEQQFNGKDRKTEAFLVSRWINGDDVEVRPDQAFTVTLAADATVKGGVTGAPNAALQCAASTAPAAP